LNSSDSKLTTFNHLKAVDVLTINKTHRLRRKVDVLEEKDEEIQSLKHQLNSYENLLIELKHEMDKFKEMMNEA
jgi:hypothetical protein